MIVRVTASHGTDRPTEARRPARRGARRASVTLRCQTLELERDELRACLRARLRALSELRAAVVAHGGGYFAEVAPNDRLHGVGLSFEHPLASVPVAWRETGSNVLGWAYMTVAKELAGPARRGSGRPGPPPGGGGQGGRGSGSSPKDAAGSDGHKMGGHKRDPSESPHFPDPAVSESDMQKDATTSLADHKEELTKLETRMEAVYQRYLTQFTAMESLMASMDATKAYLTGQLESLSKAYDD